MAALQPHLHRQQPNAAVPPPVPPRPYRNIWAIGTNLGQNPSVWKQIRHSRFADAFRRASGTRLAHAGVKFAITMIPIPAVQNLVTTLEQKCRDKLREWQVSRNLAWIPTDHKKFDQQDREHFVKWQWKNPPGLDEFDRFRWKVSHGVEMVNKTVEILENQGIMADQPDHCQSASVCNDTARAISKFAYLVHRIEKFRAAVIGLKELCDETDKWLKHVEDQVQMTDFKNKVARLKTVHTFGPHHFKCDPTLCVFGDHTRLWENEHYKKIYEFLGPKLGTLINDSSQQFNQISTFQPQGWQSQQ